MVKANRLYDRIDRLYDRIEPFSALFWALGIVLAHTLQ